MAFEKFRKYQKQLLILFAALLILPMGVGGAFYALFTSEKLPHAGIVDGRKISGAEFQLLPYYWHRVLGYFPSKGEEPTDEDIWFVHCALALADKWDIKVSKAEVDQVVQYVLLSRGLKDDSESLRRMLEAAKLTSDEFYKTVTQYARFVKLYYGYLQRQAVYPTRARAFALFYKGARKARVDFIKLEHDKFEPEMKTGELDKRVAAYYEKHKDDDWLRVPEKVVIEYMGVNYKDYERAMVRAYYEEHKREPWMTTTRPAKKEKKQRSASAPAKTPQTASAPVKRLKSLEEAYDEIVEKIGKEEIRAELSKYVADAEEELRKLPEAKRDMEPIRKAFGMIPDKVVPSKPLSREELYTELKPLSAMIMPGGRFDYRVKQFPDLAFEAEPGEIYRVENTRGIYLFRILRKIPAHTPALDEGETRKIIVQRIKDEKAKVAALEEANRLKRLWEKDDAALRKQLKGGKKYVLESKEITRTDPLPFARDAFGAKEREVHIQQGGKVTFVWRVDRFIEPPFDDFAKNEKRYRDNARFDQIKLAGRLWRKEILELLEEDNLKAYRAARDRRKKAKEKKEAKKTG